jgi:hypothetical protein
MDHEIDKQEPSGKEGGEMKAGDKVWVQCEVVNRKEGIAWVEVGSKCGRVWVNASDCRPVEPAIEACTKTANDQLRQSLMDYPFGEPSNCPEIPDSSIDLINPSHYKQGGIECIEAIKAATGDAFVGYVWGNVLKYLWRWPKKGGVDDLKKARWYLDRLIQEVGE